MRTFKTLLAAISKAVEAAACLLLVALVCIASFQVFSRYALKATPSWSEEISVILVVWFGLLGAGLGVRDGSHLAVEFLVRGMSGPRRLFFHRLSNALVACFALVMIVAGARLVAFVSAGNETNPATGIPVAYTYLAIPVSGAFILLHALNILFDIFAGKAPPDAIAGAGEE